MKVPFVESLSMKTTVNYEQTELANHHWCVLECQRWVRKTFLSQQKALKHL